MRFNIYYGVDDKRKLIRENVSKENVIKYLKSLTVIEKSHIYLEPVKEINKEKEEDNNECRE